MTTIPNSTNEHWFTILLRSTDGGANWWNVSPWRVAQQAEDIQEVFFLGGDHAWIVTSGEPADTGGRSFTTTTVWRTQDGGQTWNTGNPVTYPSPYSWDMVFVDDQHGWLMVAGDIAMGSQSATVFRTMNGGMDWEEVSATSIDDWPPAPGQISSACYKNHIWFRDISTGWVIGECLASGFFVQVTFDGGLSWEFQDRPSPAEDPDVLDEAQCAPFRPVFSSAQTGVLPVVCMFDTVLVFHTYDGGQTWELPSYRRERQIGTVDFVDADNGWLFYFDDQGEKHLAITKDGGQTWSEINPHMDYASLNRPDFVDSKVGWDFVYDESRGHSSVCKTADSGIIWACLTPQMQPGAPRR